MMKYYSLLLTLLLTFTSATSTPTQITCTQNFSVIESDFTDNSDLQIPLEIIPLNDDIPDGN